MIETHDLSKQFDGFTAVDGVSLTIQPGQVLALLGPNGAGKTTTVRMLTSILAPSRGWARIAGYDVVKQPAQVRASVGVLTEMHGLYGRMPADDYLDFFGQVYNMPASERKAQIRKLLDEYGLFEDRRRKIGEYSKGMRQKLALARALMHNPPVLLLDEPTSAMDPESARLVRDAIHHLRSVKRAIIICTHNLPEAEELADQIAIIRRGKIIALGSPNQLKQTLLGAVEYEVRLAQTLNGSKPVLPDAVQLTNQGSDWFRFTSPEPQQFNPSVLGALVSQGYAVVSLSEVSRSLENVYLQAITANDSN
jgi:ABC-2 type transport system ATP-binding protein